MKSVTTKVTLREGETLVLVLGENEYEMAFKEVALLVLDRIIS